MRNSFVNLALPLLIFSEPNPTTKKPKQIFDKDL